MQKNFKYLGMISVFFVSVLLISNVASTKIVDFKWFTFDGGTLLFPLSYIFGDVLTEVYGYKRSRSIIWLGFFMALLMSIIFIIVGRLPSAPGWDNQAAYDAILGLTPRIVIASLIAYFSGEFSNSYILAKMKIWTKGKMLWARTIGSTIVGELVDSCLFIVIAFAGILPNSLIVTLIISNYIFKTLVEVAFTPITYKVIAFLKKNEQEDYYDIGTNFNPFIGEDNKFTGKTLSETFTASHAMTLFKKISVWLSDYQYMFLGAGQGLIYRTPPKHYLEHTLEGKVPVILIPGILGKWSFMKTLGDKISLAGHPVYIVPELGYNLFDIPSSAQKILDCLNQIEISKNGGVVFVTHSKGGLIGKYFLTNLNDDQKVLGMVAVATPFSGSSMAKLIPFDSISELDTDSKIIDDLKKHKDINSKIISIRPEYDNHVWSEEGSFLEDAENIEVPVHGHHKIIFDKNVQNIILDSIDKISIAGKKY